MRRCAWPSSSSSSRASTPNPAQTCARCAAPTRHSIDCALSEAERATLEERTRLARELHDGLAQDLWFAKLKHQRLIPYVPDDQKALAEEVTQAIDSAIQEAKQAVVTMRAAEDRERPLEELMSRTIDEFAARSGVRADFSAADLPSELPVSLPRPAPSGHPARKG